MRFYPTEAIAETNNYFMQLNQDYNLGIKKLEHYWTYSITLRGDKFVK